MNDHDRAEAIVAKALERRQRRHQILAEPFDGPPCEHYFREAAKHRGENCPDCRYVTALMAGDNRTLVEMRAMT